MNNIIVILATGTLRHGCAGLVKEVVECSGIKKIVYDEEFQGVESYNETQKIHGVMPWLLSLEKDCESVIVVLSEGDNIRAMRNSELRDSRVVVVTL